MAAQATTVGRITFGTRFTVKDGDDECWVRTNGFRFAQGIITVTVDTPEGFAPCISSLGKLQHMPEGQTAYLVKD